VIIWLALGAVPSFAAQKESLSRFTFTEYHMGVDARITVYAKDRTTAETACVAGFEKMAALDTIMSDYRKNSELMRLCAKAGGPPVTVSRDLFDVLVCAKQISSQSDGLFDVTIGPLIKLWRAARKTKVLPTPNQLREARKLVGWRHVHLDPRTRSVRLDLSGTKLDLGAIGKGYADGEVQKVLKSFGVDRALVEMGGDIVVTGPPPDRTGWTIEVPNSVNPKSRFLTLANSAISTSGDTFQFVVIGGKKYSHVVNPHTGMALTKGVQATVVAPIGTETDGLSTALTLLSPRGRKRLLSHYPHARAFVRSLPFRDKP
jgi:thiamine biosynthesis lipoprotein